MKNSEDTMQETGNKNYFSSPSSVVKIFDQDSDGIFTKQQTPNMSDYINFTIITNSGGSLDESMKIPMSKELNELFESNPVVKKAFERLPQYHKKQYILWIESSIDEDIKQERMNRLVKIFSQRFGNL